MNLFIILVSTVLCSVLNMTVGTRPGVSTTTTPESISMENSGNLSGDFIVTLNNSVDHILDYFEHRHFPSRTAKLEAMTKALKDNARASQKHVEEEMKRYNVETEYFWITNEFLVKNATPQALSALRAHGSVTVSSIRRERVFAQPPSLDARSGTKPNGSEWGIKKIGAEMVWKETRGNGVVVAVIDTGVRATHNALRDSYVGAENNGWYDPISHTNTPSDYVGHGSHCAGIICGSGGIGVAPAAKWMACRACDADGCTERDVIACGQWLLCPTDPQGENPDCSKAPHIVSNSWSFEGGQTWFNSVIKAWNVAGIIGFFSIGNEGPECGTGRSPGDQPGLISVGSTNINDEISTFSSRGPRFHNGNVSPTIVAPGENINSAGYANNNAYLIRSGTSMSTPLAAGAAALLLSKDPGLGRQGMEQLLISTANQNLTSTGPACGNGATNVYPNNVKGHGRIDVNRAFMQLSQRAKSN